MNSTRILARMGLHFYQLLNTHFHPVKHQACRLIYPLSSSILLSPPTAQFAPLLFQSLQPNLNYSTCFLFQFLLPQLFKSFSSLFLFYFLSLFYFLELPPNNPSYSSLCHLGRHPWIDSSLLGLTTLLVSPDFSERHSYWPETQLCLPEMLLDQQLMNVQQPLP